jgi:hypothetical protein
MARRVSELYASSFDAIFPRDAESLRDLVSFAPSAAGGRVEAGLDGAFLLAPAGFVSRGASTRPSPLRYFFGRSGFTGTNRLLLKAGLALRRPPRQMPGWLDVRPEHNGRTYIACQFDRIRGAAAVLTDTYHLCVNALNLGVPVVGIGKPAARQITAAGDFKKSVLFDSLGLRDFYVDRPALDVEARKRIVAALKAASRGAPAWELAMGRLAEMRHLYRTRLEAEIF